MLHILRGYRDKPSRRALERRFACSLSSGFALPTVLVASAVMLGVLAAAVQSTVAVRNSLESQVYESDAKLAAESGIEHAIACMAENEQLITWTDENPLTPATNCSGIVVTGRPAFIKDSEGVRTRYVVQAPQSAQGSFLALSTGSTERIRASTGIPWRTYTSTQYANITLPLLVSLDGGYEHSIGLSVDRSTLFAWGLNSSGQLGNGTTTALNVPTIVLNRTNLDGSYIEQVIGGGYHTLALTGNGRVYAWGMNTEGQLGVGDNTNRLSPTPVATAGTPMDGKDIVAIGAGRQHSIAVDSDGRVYTWGWNNFGQLGNNTTTSANRPVAVRTTGTPLDGKVVLSAESNSNSLTTVARTADGWAYAWGENSNGQLGDQTLTSRSTPVAINGAGTALQGKTVAQVINATQVSYVLTTDGNIFVLGQNNNHGEYANGTYGTGPLVPHQVNMAGTPLQGKLVTKISADGFHIVALTSEGLMYSWGWNIQGQLGIGLSTGPNTCDSWVPEPCSLSIRQVVTAGTPMNGRRIISLSTGDRTTFAVADDGTAYAWGGNAYGELGIGSTNATSNLPAQVKLPLSVRRL